MKNNPLKEKSFDFAIRIVNLYRFLITEKKEYVMSKQLLKSGTSVGALVREAEHGESKADFIHKLAIAQKECNESLFWLELLERTEYITSEQFNSLFEDAVEIMKLTTSIILTTKKNSKK